MPLTDPKQTKFIAARKKLIQKKVNKIPNISSFSNLISFLFKTISFDFYSKIFLNFSIFFSKIVIISFFHHLGAA